MRPHITPRWSERTDGTQWRNGDYAIFARDREGPGSPLELVMRFEARNMVLDRWLGEHDTWDEAVAACRDHAANYREDT